MARQRNLLFKILGIAAGVIFIVFAVKERTSLSHMKKTGKSAVVTLVGGHYTKRSQRGDTSYSGQLSFTTESGQEIVRNHGFPEEALDDFQARRPVRVYYDPRDPSEFVFEKERASWWPIVAGVLLVGVSLVMF